jgi:sugar lactone lactonase YvrE
VESETSIVADGLVFPECPRWHQGRLWFSDVHAHAIKSLGGDVRVEVANARQPAGLGWRPDGTLLFAQMVERKLARVAPDGAIETVADVSALEPVQINDMVVDARGNAYIGGFGFDLNAGAHPKPANVILVRADGSPSVAAGEVMFPNGMVITPDGRTLIVAETVARRLTAFDISGDALLSDRRVWAALDVFPDGICLDAEGGVWVASPVTGECVRVREGGEVTHRVNSHAKGVYACMLGGDDRRALYLCTANTTGPELVKGISTGWIESVRADVPGAGLP